MKRLLKATSGRSPVAGDQPTSSDNPALGTDHSASNHSSDHSSGHSVVEIPCDASLPLLAHVFKVTTDPYVGKLAMIRILQGRMDNNTMFISGAEKKAHKAGHILKVEGRDHPEFGTGGLAFAGDIVALAKVEELHVDQILHDPPTTRFTAHPSEVSHAHVLAGH